MIFINLYNEFIMNILNDINTPSCLSKNNSNTIELTLHTSCYWGLRLTLCYNKYYSKQWLKFTESVFLFTNYEKQDWPIIFQPDLKWPSIFSHCSYYNYIPVLFKEAKDNNFLNNMSLLF